MSKIKSIGTNTRVKNIKGMAFGRWTAIRLLGKTEKNASIWEFRCSCGTIKAMMAVYIKTISAKNPQASCGCFRKEVMSAISKAMWASRDTHKMSDTPIHNAWMTMIARCTKPKTKCWHNYGGRGIKVCERWLVSFKNFFADMGQRPSSQHTLDRIDNNGNYEPRNCRWATPKQQARNMRTNMLIEWHGHVRCLSEWAELLGVRVGRIHKRLKLGWPVEMAFTLAPCHRRPA